MSTHEAASALPVPAPCPFCGESHDLGIGRGTEDREGYPTYVYCGNCGAHGPWAYTRDKAWWTSTTLAAERTGWNSRFKTNADVLP